MTNITEQILRKMGQITIVVNFQPIYFFFWNVCHSS